MTHRLLPTRAGRATLFAAGSLAACLLAGCANDPLPPATLPPSGITSSNGGGMRAVGGIPDVSVTNGNATIGTMPRNPRVPTY